MSVAFDALWRKIEALPRPGDNDAAALMQAICDLLHREVPHYDWVGFYLTDPAEERMLVLGPYTGAPTDHVRIPFGRGICGQAADSLRTFVVQDVNGENNYLSCSPFVKSEIVLPVLAQGVLLGELDIDSHTVAPFTPEDELFLGKVCDFAARYLTK